MALVVITFKFVCRLAQRVHALDVRHSQMSTTRTCSISVNFCVVAFYALHLRRDIGRMATAPQFTNQMTVFSPLGIRGECRSPRLHSGQTSDAEHLSCWSPERALCFSYSGRTLKFARIWVLSPEIVFSQMVRRAVPSSVCCLSFCVFFAL